MKIKDLIQDLAKIPDSLLEKEIGSIVCDSRKVTPDSLFFALKGAERNGADFISEAMSRGAIVVGEEGHAKKNTIVVPDPAACLKSTLLRFYANPSSKVKTFGVTGTNGKTTITYLIENIFKEAHLQCGVIGTVNHRIGKKIFPSQNTTPGIIENQKFLSQLERSGINFCAMEVSSHALAQGRVDLIDFDTAIFSNLTGDHLDYHGDMENYFQAKALLFTRLSKDARAVINKDCPYGKRLLTMSQGKVFSYGLNKDADFSAGKIELKLNETNFTIKLPDGRLPVKTNLIGLHNVYNILAAIATCYLKGISVEAIQNGIANINIPGRLEAVKAGQDFHVLVDYAHTDDALANVLNCLRNVSESRVILVFGCGGDRDTTKRPKMGKVASDLADWTILTSDNPRSEKPKTILSDIRRGFSGSHFEIIEDREEAIYKALELAEKDDIVLIAGKGHENYQIFKDRTLHFDDREVVHNKLDADPAIRHS